MLATKAIKDKKKVKEEEKVQDLEIKERMKAYDKEQTAPTLNKEKVFENEREL